MPGWDGLRPLLNLISVQFILIASALLVWNKVGVIFAPQQAKSQRKVNITKVVSTNTSSASSPSQFPKHKNLDTRLWIYVDRWAEGIGSWTQALAQLIVLAPRLNATVVEPCVQNGRLHSCSRVSSTLRVSEIYNLAAFPLFHIVTEEEFRLRIKGGFFSKTIPVCMSMRTQPAAAQKDCRGLPNRAYQQNIPELDEALNLYYHGNSVVLNITSFWKHTMQTIVYVDNSNTSISVNVAEQVGPTILRNLKFRQQHYEAVDKMLTSSGVKDAGAMPNYTVIQWRAEKEGLDFVACAKHLIDIKHQLSNSNNHSFVLMSSLHTEERLMWGGTQRAARNGTSSAQEALQLLFQDGFQKLDTIVHPSFTPDGFKHTNDSSILGVWDLILAYRAKTFMACSRACRSRCADCNHLGNFADLAMAFRYAEGKPSVPCWED